MSLCRLYPRIPYSLPTESYHPFSSPVRTSIPLWLRVIWSHSVEAMTARWTTACHWWLQMRRSCQAQIKATAPLHSEQPSASSPGMDADLFRVLSNAVEEWFGMVYPRGTSSTSFAIYPIGPRRDHQILACTLLVPPTCLF